MATIEKRKNKDGTTSYRVKVRKCGFPHVSKTFASLAEAKRWAGRRALMMQAAGYLVRLAEAAKDIRVDVGDLLEYAEENDGVSGPLRVCVDVPDSLYDTLMRFPTPQPEPPGLQPHDRSFAYVFAPNTPGFFRSLARDGAATLEGGDSLVMLDGSGWIWADGLIVELKGCWVPRVDVEAVSKDLAAPK